MILSAISIMQPWPYAIFHLGVPVLIHAGKREDAAGDMYLRYECGFAIPDSLPLGGTVGFAVFTVQCGQRRTSDWAAPGLYNWPIVASGELPFHPCKGSLGFFKTDYPHPLPERIC